MIYLITKTEMEKIKELAKPSIISRLNDTMGFFTLLEDNSYLISFFWMNGEKSIIFANEKNFYLATESNFIKECANRIDVEGNGILQLHEFFLELTATDLSKLETLENLIILLERNLLTSKKHSKNGLKDIVKVKKDLLIIKRYYEEMGFLFDELAAVNPSFSFMGKRFDRLLSFLIHLQGYLEQVLDAYQSQIDLEHNEIMKFFTVITSIFLPLTLITGWYGMNLRMPEFHWPYGYPFVISITLLVISFLVYLFRKKKWL